MWRRFKVFLPYFKEEWRGFLVVIIALFIIDAIDLTLPPILGYFINNLTEITQDMYVAYWGVVLALSYVSAIFFMGIFRRIMNRNSNNIAQVIANRIRRKYFMHLETLPSSFYNETRIGDLMSRATSDVEALQRFYGIGVILFFDVIFNLAFIPVILMKINWRLALYITPILPIVPFFVIRVGDIIHRRFEDVQKKMADLSAYTQEHISGIRIVKAYTQEDNVLKGLGKLSKEYLDQNVSLSRWTAMFHPTLMFAIGISSAVILLVGGHKVLGGEMRPGDLITFLMYINLIMWPLTFLGMIVNIFQQASASMERVQFILNTKPEIADGPDTLDISSIEGEIEFRNCSYAYNGNRVLNNINLKIRHGETLAIVGHVGCGKSTLVNLLPRMINPNEGEVFIDGIDVRKMPLRMLRQKIGFIPQEIYLFSTSIQENIRFGREEASDAEVLEAARISRLCNDFNELPDGYNTLLGEKGVNLSGGQKQRVAIARGVILKPKILVLDDALSSVDADTEREILIGLKEVMRERTSIVISHRISAIKDADRIIVLENGSIVEEGDHAALLKVNGIYARMYSKQQLEREIEEN
jgi:ATP-binding cassette, subfamily B, multidrug efflux pump